MRKRSSIDNAARRLTNGQFVRQSSPGNDTSDVSQFIRHHKDELIKARKDIVKAPR